ncbi:MAG: NADH-quinone oxidoreductase subunit NuoE [Phycisphaerales bacterium]|nr:NADH-quinone oxidoreductase subunit NuoE [Phycisphaerales bacterium]
MAWITKNSGTARVEHRAEPYLTPAMQADLRARVLPRYESAKGALLLVLNEVQHAYGWLPEQAMEEVAAFLGLPAADVLDTASFYEEYWLKPRGKHVVGVCRSIACEFCGQSRLTQAIKDRLGIEVGETTDDGRFTLIELECLGACGGAPAMLIDETLHECVKPEDVGTLLAAVKDNHPH